MSDDLVQERMKDLAAERRWQQMTRSLGELVAELNGKGLPETRVAIMDGSAIRSIESIEVSEVDGTIEIHLRRPSPL